MKVTGFTFIRNAITYDYPVVEAITSILSLCDEFVVAVGKSDDGTRELIAAIHPKIKIIDTLWDDSLREGGRVLAEETNKAYQQIDSDSDWAFYIQGDEVVHEQYLDSIKQAMLKYKDNDAVDGLLFHYRHFYGSYDYVGMDSKWYRNEIRIVRKRKDIYSYGDAMGFRKGENEKLSVKAIDAYIHHYGWVKPPEAMQRKQEIFHKLWHSDDWVAKNVVQTEKYDYLKNISELEKYTGSHPEVMKKRIDRVNWKFDYDISFNKRSLKDTAKHLLRKYLGINLGYKNYRKI